MTRFRGLRTALAVASLALLAGDGWSQGLPACSQDHPSAARRRESILKNGDARMAQSVAGHTTRYAVQRYGLQGLVSEEEIHAKADMLYHFLVWKLGSPFLVAAQLETGGYEHFDKTYSDEAGGMLVGVFDFKRTEPELLMPEWMQEYVRKQVGNSGEAIAGFLAAEGIPAAIAKILADKVEQELLKLYDRNSVGVYLPKRYDIDNRFVEEAVRALKESAGGAKGGGNPFSKGGWKTNLPGEIEIPDGPSTPGPFGNGGPLGNGPGAGGGTNGHGSEIELVIARLEARVAALERIVAELTSGAASSGRTGAGGLTVLESVDSGYEGVYLDTNVWGGGGRLSIRVNGTLVGTYDGSKDLDVSRFLQRGRLNEVSFGLEPHAETSAFSVTLRARFAGGDEWMDVYSFTSRKGQMGDTVEIPIAP